jgi:hypothetical protein
LYATVGVHPEYTDVEEPDEDRELALAAHPKVIAIGETGLDYYWHKDKPEWQRERFRTHIRAARRAGKPLVVHTRDSAADTLRVLKEEGADTVGGVMHCFTENWEIASLALDLGFYLSFSGIVTFKNARSSRKWRANARSIVFSSKPIRLTWRRFLSVASRTSLPMSAMWQRKLPVCVRSRLKRSTRPPAIISSRYLPTPNDHENDQKNTGDRSICNSSACWCRHL